MSFLDELERDLVRAAERRRDARQAAFGVRVRRGLHALRARRSPDTAQRAAATARPPRASGGERPSARIRRIVLATLLFALIGATTAGAGLLLLRATVIPGPAVRDVPRDQLPLPGTTRLTGLTADDPVAGRPPWTLRLARSSTGLLCSTVGQLDGGRFGLVGLDGRFRVMPERIVDACGERLGGERASLVGARVFDADDPQEVRTVVNGVAGPALRAVSVEVRGRARPVPVGPGGTFLAVLPGYPEDSGVQATLRFASGRTELHPLGRSAIVAPDPEGGQAWKSMAYVVAGDRRSCVAFSTARPHARNRAGSPAACGVMRHERQRSSGFYFAVRRIAGDDGRAQSPLGGWNGHPPRTAVWGGAGDEVEQVEVSGPGGIRATLPIAPSRTFFGVFPGDVDPADLAVTLRFADGRTRTFHGSTNLATRKLPARTTRATAAPVAPTRAARKVPNP
jgi:hypothetical protein